MYIYIYVYDSCTLKNQIISHIQGNTKTASRVNTVEESYTRTYIL